MLQAPSHFPPFTFASRRSPVFSTNGMVATSQPAATMAGLTILQQGGTAADAAVAIAACLAVIEPCSTGPGGDAFALCYDASTQSVHSLNGSGISGKQHTISAAYDAGFNDELPPHHGFCVTVPGAVAAWNALHQRFGKLDFEQTFLPAIDLARKGVPLGPVTSELWTDATTLTKHNNQNVFLPPSTPLRTGTTISNEPLAQFFEHLSKFGASSFYSGDITKRIVAATTKAGGVLTLEDFAAYAPQWDTPLSMQYGGITVHECPPNGQGIVALSALSILKHTPHSTYPPLSPERLHYQIEALRLAFADARRYVCDPRMFDNPWEDLFDAEYSAMRAKKILEGKRNAAIMHGTPDSFSDTVQFCVVDAQGNAVSMVNSVYMNYGSGIVPENCGFVLQNRGHNFSLVEDHPNCLAPLKRPYHTIIPCLTTYADNSLHGVHGIMGGFMQPQGHVQLLSSLLDDMDRNAPNPQLALDQPRFCIMPDGSVAIEEGMPEKTIETLKEFRHPVTEVTGYNRKLFGRGQSIVIPSPASLHASSKSMIAGSDPRADGCAQGLW